MTRTNLPVAAATLAVLGLSMGCKININLGKPLVGSGVSLTETRETDPFTGIEVSGAINVQASIGATQSIQVVGDDNIVPLVTTNVRNGTLKIQIQHNGSLDTKVPLTVTIVAAELVAADLSGACNVEATGLTGTDFDVDLSGASKLKVSGDCGRLTADISGASTFDGESLTTKNAKIDLSGAANVRVHASESISGDASGASTLRYFGNPTKTEIDSSGASTVKSG